MINSFTFYRDYFNLIDTMPKEDKITLLVAITDYMFKNIEPELEGHNQAIFNTLRNQLNVSKNNSGRGGRPKKETETKTEQETDLKPNSNQKDNRLKNKTSILSFKFYISNLNINNNIKDILYKWLEYKQDIKDMYKSETSIKTLVNQVIKNCETYGEEKVIEIINESISNGYKGIIFNKLKQESNRYKTQSQRNKEFFDKMRKELEDGEEESN